MTHDVVLGALIHRGHGGHETRVGARNDGVRVIVKTVAGDAPPEAHARLDHEAELLARLRGIRGVPELLAYSAIRATLVTREAAGADLHTLREAGSLRGGASWRVTLALVALIRRLHRRGVVHRDVSPSNVIVDLTTGSMVLCDFGQARDVRCPTSFEAQWTDTAVGTPRFRAAELTRDPTSASFRVDYVSAFRIHGWMRASRQGLDVSARGRGTFAST